MRVRPAAKTTLAAAILAIAAGPATAATGGAGMSQPAPKRAASAPVVPPGPVLAPVASIPQLSAGVSFRKVSRRAVSAAALTYVSHARGPLQVRVDVVRIADGYSVFTDERTVQPETSQKVTWNGRAGNRLALDGRYQLRISLGTDAGASSAGATAPSGGGGAAPEAAAPPPGSASVRTFTFVGAVFPVRGPHDYGQGAAAFGAGRAGHVHQGQDVMAACGTPLVAARGGRVVMRAYQALAGNYVVIQDPITGQSNMYAHLRTPALVKRGQRVETGQPIGVVGETGDATACHLHFEIWTAPGWYRGGAPIDPLPTLKRWDRFS
ncbi:MAG: M23 family metallopeptidase [Actinobacteria bacterium]|nr:M23 family metallopeptidase [Actinomycetota bacterium]